MNLQMFLISTIIISLSRAISLGCPQRNISCNDIETANGFKILHKCPEGSEIFVHYNETVIAHAAPGNQHFDVDLVMSMDNLSVVTRHCRDLEAKCIIPDRGTFVKETCVNYKLTTENLEPSELPTQWRLIISIPVGGAVLIWMILCCLFRKKKLKKGTSQTVKGETEETRPSAGSVVLEVTADDLDSVISIDPRTDCKTPQSLSLDRNLSKEGIQLPKNGDTSTPDVNSASNYQAMHRNLRDDPGGKDIVRIRVMHNGQTLGDGGREDHENEGQPLLSNQRAAIQGFDMTGEAAALVNKHSFDPDQVSGCSTAPETDVESTPNMKN